MDRAQLRRDEVASSIRRSRAFPAATRETEAIDVPRTILANGSTGLAVAAPSPGDVQVVHSSERLLRQLAVLRMQQTLGNAHVQRYVQRQATQPQATPQQLDPLRKDEAGKGFFSASYQQLTIFIPSAVTLGFRDEITDLKVHVMFVAGGVQGNTANDVLTHGERGASDSSLWVTIAAPGVPGGAFLLSDSDIRACLDSVGIKTPISTLRLSGHSRGGDSLAASIIQKKIANVSIIDHVFFLDSDSVTSHGKKIDRIPQLVSMGIPASKITAYEVNVTAGNKTKGATFVGLPPNGMAAIGYVRLIQDAMVTQTGIAAQVSANPDITSQLSLMTLPPRGSFITGTPTGSQVSLQDFCKQNSAAINTIIGQDTHPKKGLLTFINKNDLARYGGYQFSRGIAAHHFFVAEIAQELTQ